jgi:hypothetical protein
MTPATVPFEVEEFWEDLLAFIEERRVIPVVGAELLTIEENGETVPLYRSIAERLLNKYSAPVAALCGGTALREHHELNDAVCALAAAGRRVRDLYRPINDILQKLLAGQWEPIPVLRKLALISHFDLFATTTPDDLLARALDAVRFGGAAQTDQIEYAPKLPTERRRDIPETPSSKYTAVLYLFGKADVSPFYTIHDEDALEFAYTMQGGSGLERVLSQLRNRNLLLIGCTFGDWLSRFFIRLSNSERLFSDHRTKKEFLAGEEISKDHNFNVFLQRFSRDSRSYPMDACAFVTELYRRWSERNPATPGPDPEDSPTPSPSGSIFISYCKEDVAAAKKLFAALQEIGGDVAWFDKSALKAGDAWERQILSAIQRCSLFLPLISSNTEQRAEGYFRREWEEAAERSRRIQGRKFIVPIVVDPEYNGALTRHPAVPEKFQAFQYSHAPRGQMTGELREELKGQLRILRRARSV